MTLLDKALALPEEERIAFIEASSKGNEDQKERLLSLIEAQKKAEETRFFDRLGQDINPLTKPPQDQKAGKSYGHYTVGEKLGQGGMGVVYKAQDTKLQRQVALKFLPEHLLLKEEIQQRFLNEARAAAALDHPNICTIYEINNGYDTPFIAMALVVGRSLKEVLRHESLEITEALRLAIQICEGVVAAHEKNIIHRDIKPANLMINESGRVVVMDFGLAKLPDTEDLSKSGTTRGTIAYMSPEQAMGQHVNERTDIWSLGVVLYEMLTNARPFTGDYEHAIIYSIIHRDPIPVETHRSGIPVELKSILRRALQKDPTARYSSALEMLEALRSIDSTLRLRKEIKRSSQKLPSIAVLPFVNMSPDPENDYFCEGLAEDLINGLAHLSELRVAARTSSFAFKNKDTDAQEIGRRLHVDHLLEGSVRKMGDKVRIVAQLIKVEDGYHLWSERYDRVLEDVFDVQDELVIRIVDALKVKLLGDEKTELVRRTTDNPEAYTTYLKARFHWNRRTQHDLEQAIKFSKQAVDIDPSFASAYSCLADSKVLTGLYGYEPGSTMYPRAMEAAKQAIMLDDKLAEAHTSLGAALVFCDWDWSSAERACRKALAINPNYPTGHSFFAGFVLAAQGRFAEAINEIGIAQHNDPLSFIIHTAAGVIHWQAQQYEKAFELAANVIETIPQFWLAHALQGLVYEQWEEYSEAIEAFEKANHLAGTRSSTLGTGMLGHALARAGKLSLARKKLNELDENHPNRYVSPFDKAVIYAGLREDDNVFKWLEASVTEKSSWMVLVNVDPRFDYLKNDERFAHIKSMMKLR